MSIDDIYRELRRLQDDHRNLRSEHESLERDYRNLQKELRELEGEHNSLESDVRNLENRPDEADIDQKIEEAMNRHEGERHAD